MTFQPVVAQPTWPKPSPWVAINSQSMVAGQLPGLSATNPMPQTAQRDWPVARAAPRLPQDHTKTPQLSVVASPAAQTDWPIPTTRPAPRPDLQASRFLGFPANPQIAQYDWPVPRGAKPVVADYVRGSPQALRLDVKPFVQTDWPVVRRVPALLQDDLAGQFAGLPATNPMPAIAQLDWPVVRAIPRRPQDFTTWKQLTATSPIVPMDWPVTRATLRPIQDWTRSQFLGLPTANAQPFSTPERPNPRAAPRVVSDFILQSPQALRLDVKPFTQTDWPVARGAAPLRFDQAVGRFAGFVSATPFKQTEWPAPPRRALSLLQDWLRGRFPGLTGGGSVTVSPGVGNVVLAGLIPSLTNDVAFGPGPGAVGLLGASPTLSAWLGVAPASDVWTVLPPTSDDWVIVPEGLIPVDE